ncbi:ankyrin [Periconia macrospinosa]|uniref:Ankyrin n=1 Tax=Periconia macrospinosa TaxID=97972 RepID=A0A2V1DUV4_9PLEO|nr:ankyrin [Periconia macrospinosa]
MSPRNMEGPGSPTDKDEDWRKLTDTQERRRVQNRIAQRNYRRNIKLRLLQLEMFNRGLSGNLPPVKRQHSFQPVSKQLVQVEKAPLRAIDSPSVDMVSPTGDFASTDISMAGHTHKSSVQTISSCSSEETDALPLMTNQEDSDTTSQPEGSSAIDFHSIASITDLENDFTIFDRDTMPLPPANSQHSLNALQQAVVGGRYNIAKLLVESGADVFTVDEFGNNILHLAARSGHAAMVTFALRNYIDVNNINAMGTTPLHIAIEKDNAEIVQMLLRAGADMELKS